MAYVNTDVLGIDILNGDAVTGAGDPAIRGVPDGSTTAVLTVNNGSSLTVNVDDLIIGDNSTGVG